MRQAYGTSYGLCNLTCDCGRMVNHGHCGARTCPPHKRGPRAGGGPIQSPVRGSVLLEGLALIETL
jgi:hypothetical protein